MVRAFFLPFRGEFGMKLVHHIPAVHAFDADYKLVICEIGEEALYPSATEFQLCERNCDFLRRDRYQHDGTFLPKIRQSLSELYGAIDSEIILTEPGLPKRYFRPAPISRLPSLPIPDIVICPRKRRYGEEKNWPYWDNLAKALRQDFSIAAAGAPDSSATFQEASCFSAWDSKFFTDISIALIRSAKLVIATDSGLAHLAVWCGTPLIIISYADGKVAPGPVRNERGEIDYHQYWNINLHEYQNENHLQSPVTVLPNSWHDIDLVLTSIYSHMKK